jgi:hypothetical protein
MRENEIRQTQANKDLRLVVIKNIFSRKTLRAQSLSNHFRNPTFKNIKATKSKNLIADKRIRNPKSEIQN